VTDPRIPEVIRDQVHDALALLARGRAVLTVAHRRPTASFSGCLEAVCNE
jgi:hypothetical protein